MSTLVLKVALTPALIGAASLAGRRWGPAVSGWLVGLPFTSAPVALVLALDHGPAFAAFFLVVAVTLEPAGIAPAFAAATAVTLAVQGATLLVLRAQAPRKSE